MLFKQQAEDMEKQQRQLMEQHRVIQEQQEIIKLLYEQRKALIQEYQTAGLTLPQIVMENLTPSTSVAMSSLHTHPQSFPPHPPNAPPPPQQQQQQSKVIHHVPSRPVSQPPPPLPPPQIQQPASSTQLPPSSLHSMHQGPVLSPPMSQHPPPIYPNVSPESCTPPPHLTAPVHKQQLKQQQTQQASSQQQQLPPYPPPPLHPQHINHLPPPPSLHPAVSVQHSISPAMTVMSSSSMAFSQRPPVAAVHTQMMLPGGAASNTFLNQAPRPPLPPSGGMAMLGNIGRTSSVSQGGDMMAPPGAGGGPPIMATRQPFGTNNQLRTDPSPILRDLTFSPLTSSEFKELERQSLASYSTNPMAAFDTFPDDLENIVNIAGGLPTGSGAGYGVGVLEEDNKPLQLDLRYGHSVLF